MKNQELFDKTITVLVKAYQKNTLRHQLCWACAVGNIVAAANGSPLNNVMDSFDWEDYYHTLHAATQNIASFKATEAGFKQIEKTGYTPIQLLAIEKAFEREKNDIDGFNGLMAVVDCLMEIHEATTEQAESAKSLFVKV